LARRDSSDKKKKERRGTREINAHGRRDRCLPLLKEMGGQGKGNTKRIEIVGLCQIYLKRGGRDADWGKERRKAIFGQ